MKGRIFIVALLVLVMASLSFGQLFKFPVTGDATTIGQVVDSNGDLATYGADAGGINAYGIVVQVHGDDLLVASSGMFPFTAAAGIEYTLDPTTPGALVDRSTLVDFDPADEWTRVHYPVVAVQMSGDAAMIVMNTYQASETEFTWPNVGEVEAGFLGLEGGEGGSPATVQEALEAVHDALSSMTAGFYLHDTGPALEEVLGDDYTITVTHVPTGAAPAVDIGDRIYIGFQAEVSDLGGISGAQFTITVRNGTTVVLEREVYLLDRDYHQRQIVSLEWFATDLEDNAFSVEVNGDAVYNSGHLYNPQLTVERF